MAAGALRGVLLCGALVSASLVAGCVRVGYESATSSDGLRRDRVSEEASSDSSSGCSWRGSFTLDAPAPVGELNTVDGELGSFLTADRLTLYFGRMPAGGADTDMFGYRAIRSTPDGAFGAATKQFAVGGEAQFDVSSDGHTAYVATWWAGGESDIWWAIRADATVPLVRSDFSPLTVVNTAGAEHDPFPSFDGLRLYLMSSGDLFYSERTSVTAPYGARRPVPGNDVSTADTEDKPVLTADERVLFFARRGPGWDNADLYYALRDGRDDAFGTPQKLPVVNTANIEWQIFVTPDGCEVWFSSERPGGKGSDDLYRTSYRKLF